MADENLDSLNANRQGLGNYRKKKKSQVLKPVAWSIKQNARVSTVPCCFKRSHRKLSSLQWSIGEIAVELFFLDQEYPFHSCNWLKMGGVSWE